MRTCPRWSRTRRVIGLRFVPRPSAHERRCSPRRRSGRPLPLAPSRTSSGRTSASSSAGSTRASSRTRPRPTSPTRATTSGGCCTRPASRPGCTSRPSSSRCCGEGIGLTNAAPRTTRGSGDLRRARLRRRRRAARAAAPELRPGLDRLRRQGGLSRHVQRAPRARPAEAAPRRDAALRPAVDVTRERGRAVGRAAALVPQAARERRESSIEPRASPSDAGAAAWHADREGGGWKPHPEMRVGAVPGLRPAARGCRPAAAMLCSRRRRWPSGRPSTTVVTAEQPVHCHHGHREAAARQAFPDRRLSSYGAALRRWNQIANIVEPSSATTARIASATQASASLPVAM